MAYTKIDFDEQTPLNSANLDQMETQHDEAIIDFGTQRTNTSARLQVQVVSTFPTPEAGLMILNTASPARFYYSDGASWEIMALPGDSGVG